jgi:hypothetical protein
MSLFIFNKCVPSYMNENIKIIEFKCKKFDFDVCETINNIDCECDTLIFYHKITQNLSELNEKIKNIKFYKYSPSINSLPIHLENLYLHFTIDKQIDNLPVNLKSLYIDKIKNYNGKDILNYTKKIPLNCKLFSLIDSYEKIKIPKKCLEFII